MLTVRVDVLVFLEQSNERSTYCKYIYMVL